VTAVLLAGMAVLVLVNAFFVAAEFAFVRVNRGRLELMAATNRGAVLALRQLDDISHYLAACQFGITLASLGIGFLGEPAIANLAEPLLGGVVSEAVAVAIALLFAYVISTAAHITVGEQVPKMFAIANAETVARRVARPLEVFTRVFSPAIAALDNVSNAMLRPLGVSGNVAAEHGTSSEDLKQLIAESLAGGGLEREEAEMLSGVFRLSELDARRVMTPLSAVVFADAEDSVEAALDRCIDTGHTRSPVLRDGRPAGVVHVNDLARTLRRGGGQTLMDLVRPAPMVPETRRLDDLLADLQRDRASMAVVVDEYGRTTGIVTVEDIVEEVVGEITDETDAAVAAIRTLPDGTLFARGHAPLDDLADHDVRLPSSSEGVVSVGGWVFDRLGRLPRRGDVVSTDEFRILVDTVRERRVESVRISRVSPTGGATP
jgi:CBS domain containing-hemolysin-like protein